MSSFKNISSLNIPPGLFKEGTQYSVGKRWYDVNLIRWVNGVMTPIGGWREIFSVVATEPVRNMFTWRDHLKAPWIAVGTSDKLFAVSVIDGEYTVYDITPATLSWAPGFQVGFGGGLFGSGPFGLDDPGSIATDPDNYWSFDNFGKLLVAVHSGDGRLFSWDPTTPATVAAPITNAPVDNAIVICTDEEICMVMGGVNNPRRVKWCSRADLTDWTPTEDNTAGGFDLKSNGQIRAAVRVQGGVLVMCDADVHLLEWVGSPDYYGRRKITDETGIISHRSVVGIPGGAIWMDHSNFWIFDGNITKVICDIRADVFDNSYLGRPSTVFLGINEINQEVWAFYPSRSSVEADRYAILSYGKQPYWSGGAMARTAWINPVWSTRPLAAYGFTVYEHEIGWLNDGETRVGEIYAETGAMEIGEGDQNVKINRVWPDALPDTIIGAFPYTITFKCRQAPTANERIKGPFALTSAKGYITPRLRARQIAVRIDETEDKYWGLGKLRLRAKARGGR